jgi:hypothetical protein
VLFHTGDLDFARERVAQKFCNHRLDIVGDRHVFDAAHHHAPGQMLSLNYIRYGADVLIDPGELEHFYLIQIPLVGAATIRNGSREVLTDITTASVLNPQWSTRMFWWQGCEQVLVQVRKAPFMAFAERILGRSLHRPIAFEPRIDFARPEMARWRAWVLGLVRALDAGDALPQLTSAAYEQQLMEDFLRHQPHDMSDFIDDVDLSAAPRHLRRAVEFMRENLAEPLTVLDLADAAEGEQPHASIGVAGDLRPHAHAGAGAGAAALHPLRPAPRRRHGNCRRRRPEVGLSSSRPAFRRLPQRLRRISQRHAARATGVSGCLRQGEFVRCREAVVDGTTCGHLQMTPRGRVCLADFPKA